MKDVLAGTRAKLAEHLAPFVDPDALAAASASLDDIVTRAVGIVASELSRDFIIAPRRELIAVIRECETDKAAADAIANRVVLLQLALDKARLR
jgi:hypothetical protein